MVKQNDSGLTDGKYMRDETAKKVYVPEAMTEAYQMGYNKFHLALADVDESELTDDQRYELQVNFDMYTETAQYADVVLPKLRMLAGYHDPNATGTYTALEGDIELIDPQGYKDRQVMNIEARAQDIAPGFLDELVGEFFQGAWDGAVANTQV